MFLIKLKLYDSNHFCQPSIEVECQLIHGIQMLLGEHFQSDIKINQSWQVKLQNNITHENMFTEHTISLFSKEISLLLPVFILCIISHYGCQNGHLLHDSKWSVVSVRHIIVNMEMLLFLFQCFLKSVFLVHFSLLIFAYLMIYVTCVRWNWALIFLWQLWIQSTDLYISRETGRSLFRWVNIWFILLYSLQ